MDPCYNIDRGCIVASSVSSHITMVHPFSSDTLSIHSAATWDVMHLAHDMSPHLITVIRHMINLSIVLSIVWIVILENVNVLRFTGPINHSYELHTRTRRERSTMMLSGLRTVKTQLKQTVASQCHVNSAKILCHD